TISGVRDPGTLPAGSFGLTGRTMMSGRGNTERITASAAGSFSPVTSGIKTVITLSRTEGVARAWLAVAGAAGTLPAAVPGPPPDSARGTATATAAIAPVHAATPAALTRCRRAARRIRA